MHTMKNNILTICPCIDCLCLPMCRNKSYQTLFEECSIIDEYAKREATNHLRQTKYLNEVELVLKPTKWVWNNTI